VYDLEVIVLEFFMPPQHPFCELLGFLPICQVLMVCFNDEGFFCPYQVSPPIFNGFDNC
jgi:hypothetical protein